MVGLLTRKERDKIWHSMPRPSVDDWGEALCKAQHIKTLKSLGGRLDDFGMMGYEDAIESLKRGEMPGEEKRIKANEKKREQAAVDAYFNSLEPVIRPEFEW